MSAIVLVTCPRNSAGKVAKVILNRRLAACVNTVETVQSRYWWRGRVEAANESLLLIKTRMELFPAVEQAVRRVHPYEVPEVVALRISRGSQRYLDWISKEVVRAPLGRAHRRHTGRIRSSKRRPRSR